MNLKTDIKNEITDYCRKINPIELSQKLNISLNEVEMYLGIIKKNPEINEMMFMLTDINIPFRDGVEQLILKYIKETEQEFS